MNTLNLLLDIPQAPLSPPLAAVELHARDLAIIHKVAVYKYLTSLQLKRLFWPHAEHQTAAKRLTQLVDAGFLARRFMDSKATDEVQSTRVAVYYWPQPCQTRLQAFFIAQRDEDGWGRYAVVIKAHAHVKETSSLFLRHETAISHHFLCLEEAVARAGWRMWWMRTSPRSKAVSRWVPLDPHDPESDRVHFSPDALYALADPEWRFRVGTLEYETRDKRKSPRSYRRRVEGHRAVAEQNMFAEVLAHFIEVQNIPLRTDPARIGMHVLTLTSDAPLRDELFLACATVQSPDAKFAFGSITDVTPETVLSPIWLRAQEFFAAFPVQQRLMPGGPAAPPRIDRRELAAAPRVALTH